LRGNGSCYKEKFYGISSHRCLQMSPSVAHCNFRCVFCWRPVDLTEDTSMGEDVDDAGLIARESIEAQRKLVSGYGGAPDLVDMRKYREALEPRHAAISLAGEPTLYPRLGELIEEYRKMGMTTFLVTNGSQPQVLSSLSSEPTQLYVSLSSPDEATHLKVNRPAVRGTWSALMETLDIFPSLGCRKVVRMTMVRGLNMHSPSAYAEMIPLATGDQVFRRRDCVSFGVPEDRRVRAEQSRAAGEGSGTRPQDRASLDSLRSRLGRLDHIDYVLGSLAVCRYLDDVDDLRHSYGPVPVYGWPVGGIKRE